MLSRIRTIRSATYTLNRRYSTPPPYGDVFKNNKLKAYKFLSSPEEALQQMGAWAAALNSRTPTDYLYAMGAVFFPFLKTRPPIRWSAVYFPAWIIDADVDCTTQNGQDHTNLFRDMFIPGADTPLLSAAPLWNPKFTLDDPVPFTEDLLNQHGQEVQCIPFNVSPFSPFQIFESCDSQALCNITQDISIRLPSIKAKMFAARPMLLPLYVGQYEIGENPISTITIFTSGGLNCNDVMAPNIMGHDPLMDLYLSKSFGDLDPDAEVQRFVPFPTQGTKGPTDIHSWIRKQMKNSSNISRLASMGQLKSDDDPRIREKNTTDSDSELKRYFELSNEIIVLMRLIQTTNNAKSGAKVLRFGGGDIIPHLEGVEHTIKMLTDKLEELEEEKQKARPQWWIEWETSSQSKSEPK